MVGNGVTDDVFDGNALVPFAHGMGLISDELYQVSFGLIHINNKFRYNFDIHIIFFFSSREILVFSYFKCEVKN